MSSTPAHADNAAPIDSTLASTNLVCRRWYLMNQSHITSNRGIYFNEDETNLLLNKALMGLPWSSWLKWYSLSPLDNQGIQRRVLGKMLRQKHEHFQRILALQNQDDLSLKTTTDGVFYMQENGSMSQEDIQALERLRLRSMVPLLELEIYFNHRIAPLLPYLTSLTTLRIHLNDRFDTPLDSLFATLPMLERLDLRTTGSVTVSATTATTHPLDNQDVEATTAMATPTGQGQQPTAMIASSAIPHS
ncbi:hypothetical protein BGZ96_005025 [Linnemannia gamsii]|uniref:Uncharacterized protein n=1 Tax=Linnemannia gamsii TaxID=64522 RepID=A0ABQ7K4S6_9FUNG|nr:hypothetical protein BGZ96_005025 [Linnemannia gamsii]